MKTRSQTLFPIHTLAAAQAPVRGSWQPTLPRRSGAQGLRVVGGQPARQSLRGLFVWLARARALNALGA